MMPYQVQTTPNPVTADDYIKIAFVLAQDGKYDDAMINYQRAIDRSEPGSCDMGHATAGLMAATAAKRGNNFLDMLTRESSGLPGDCLL